MLSFVFGWLALNSSSLMSSSALTWSLQLRNAYECPHRACACLGHGQGGAAGPRSRCTWVLDLCPSRRNWCMVLWWDGSWQRKHRSYSQWSYTTIVATVHCARICYDLFSQKVSSLGSCISWKRGAEYCQILRHRSDESASISLNYEQEGNSITTCRQTLHHSGCNVKPLVLTPKHAICTVLLLGTHRPSNWVLLSWRQEGAS